MHQYGITSVSLLFPVGMRLIRVISLWVGVTEVGEMLLGNHESIPKFMLNISFILQEGALTIMTTELKDGMFCVPHWTTACKSFPSLVPVNELHPFDRPTPRELNLRT